MNDAPTFAPVVGTGKEMVPVGNSYDFGYSVVVQPDGKIVIAGSGLNGANNDFGVIRLNPNGTLDTGFNGTGTVLVPVGSSNDVGYGVIVQPDGKIVMTGYAVNGSDYDFSVIRLNANGTLDTSFNGAGKVLVPVGSSQDRGYTATVQPDGKIVVAGSSYNGANFDFSLIRLNVDGTLDTDFNGTGKTVVPVGSFVDSARSVIVQADGKIVLVGDSYVVPNTDVSVIRLNANGTLDTSFNGTGKAVVPVGSFNDTGSSVSVQPDGKIVVAGFSSNGSSTDFSLIRLNADGSLDTSFNGTANQTLGGTVAYTENAAAIALDSAVSLYDAELAMSGTYDGASITLTRTAGASPDDIFSARGNLSFSDGNAVLSGDTVGTVSNSGGSLTLTFNSNATQARVNEVLSSVGYANASDDPTASVQIDWTFSDGNTGAQGTGGALTASGITTVNITRVNDLPTGGVTVSGIATVGETLTVSNTLADAEGIDTPIAYQWKADGVDIEGAVGDAFTLTAAEFGKVISVEASYTDGRGTDETAEGTMSHLVGDVLTAMLTDKFLFGSLGDDILIASGRTKMMGGDGDDIYRVAGKGQVVEAAGEGDDTVISQVAFTLGPNLENLLLEGNRELKGTGNELDNDIQGNDAANDIAGLAGADRITGAAGADRFIYTSAADSSAVGYDTVTDFDAAEGDRIRLTQVDANEALPGNQRFTFIGAQPFSDFADATGLLRFDAGTHQLQGSVNASAGAELVILLTGVVSLTGGDIDL